MPLEEEPLLCEDEYTLYRRSRLGSAWEERGTRQPLTETGYRANNTYRYLAALDLRTGQVHYRACARTTCAEILRFYADLVAHYPGAPGLALVQDNWPVHFHPEVLAGLAPQRIPWPLPRPASWRSLAEPAPQGQRLPIRLFPLPTYASWANPVEKLWRQLSQEVLTLHRYADDWMGLREAVARFLDRYRDGSQELLRYVGLQDLDRLYRGALAACPQPDITRSNK